jgi:hypothetical protein
MLARVHSAPGPQQRLLRDIIPMYDCVVSPRLRRQIIVRTRAVTCILLNPNGNLKNTRNHARNTREDLCCRAGRGIAGRSSGTVPGLLWSTKCVTRLQHR